MYRKLSWDDRGHRHTLDQAQQGCAAFRSMGRTVAATMTRKAMMTWAAPGTKNAQRHASNSGTLCAMAVVR
jgi:hypothetical protein